MLNFDAYLVKFNPEIRRRLISMRQIALDIFGDVDELTYHSLPAFKRNGGVFMFFGAYKNHISVCIGDDLVDFFKNQYPELRHTQHTVIFSHDEPFPEGIFQEICGLVNHIHISSSNG